MGAAKETSQLRSPRVTWRWREYWNYKGSKAAILDIIELSHGMVRKHGGVWSTGGTSLPLADEHRVHLPVQGKHFGPPLTLQKLHQMIHQNLTRHAKPTPLGWVFKEACFFASAPTFYDRGP